MKAIDDYPDDIRIVIIVAITIAALIVCVGYIAFMDTDTGVKCEEICCIYPCDAGDDILCQCKPCCPETCDNMNDRCDTCGDAFCTFICCCGYCMSDNNGSYPSGYNHS